MTPYLSESAREALARLAESEAAHELPDPLTRLRDIRSLLAELDNEPAVLHSVRDALATGATWDDIATAALLKPAAAKWRWQGTDIETTLVYTDTVPAQAPEPCRREAAASRRYSIAGAAKKLGVTAQAVYLQISRGKLSARTIELPDGRKYKRVMFDEES